jgi:hypothetical protein
MGSANQIMKGMPVAIKIDGQGSAHIEASEQVAIASLAMSKGQMRISDRSGTNCASARGIFIANS